MAIIQGLTYMQFLIAFTDFVYFKFLDYKIGCNDPDPSYKFVQKV